MIDNGIAATDLVGATWRKSRFSNSKGNCAELAGLATGQVAIRQNTHPTGPALVMDRADFTAWVADVKAGGYDDLLTAA